MKSFLEIGFPYIPSEYVNNKFGNCKKQFLYDDGLPVWNEHIIQLITQITHKTRMQISTLNLYAHQMLEKYNLNNAIG